MMIQILANIVSHCFPSALRTAHPRCSLKTQRHRQTYPSGAEKRSEEERWEDYKIKVCLYVLIMQHLVSKDIFTSFFKLGKSLNIYSWRVDNSKLAS